MTTPKQTNRFAFSSLFEEKMEQLAAQAVAQFKKIVRYYALFHLLFCLAMAGQVLAFLLFISFFSKSWLLAVSLGSIFLTGFSYSVLLFYFQAKKPEQFSELKDIYLNALKSQFDPSQDSVEYRLSTAHALFRLLQLLDGQEFQFYNLASRFETLAVLMRKFSMWCHWKDLFKVKETLLFSCVTEYVELIKIQPTDLEVHASLATAYLSLSRLYRDPRELGKLGPTDWVPKDYFSTEMTDKFHKATQRALEQFKIIDHYAPNDPWVHAQLAAIYHELGQHELEIEQYKIMLRISPENTELLFRYGTLQFQLGKNWEGLKTYEQLRRSQSPKAAELIQFFNTGV
jgi:tetratricopeptide (TPR) repeat protein